MKKIFYELDKTIEIIQYSDNLTIVNIIRYNQNNETLSTIFYEDDFENTIFYYKNNYLV